MIQLHLELLHVSTFWFEDSMLKYLSKANCQANQQEQIEYISQKKMFQTKDPFGRSYGSKHTVAAEKRHVGHIWGSLPHYDNRTYGFFCENKQL